MPLPHAWGHVYRGAALDFLVRSVRSDFQGHQVQDATSTRESESLWTRIRVAHRHNFGVMAEMKQVEVQHLADRELAEDRVRQPIAIEVGIVPAAQRG